MRHSSRAWYARAGRTRDSLRIWRLIYGEYTRSLLETSAGDNDSAALSANYHWTWRDVDDLPFGVQRGRALGELNTARAPVGGPLPGVEAAERDGLPLRWLRRSRRRGE